MSSPLSLQQESLEDFSAFLEGFAARKEDQTKQDNPYRAGSENHMDWWRGWMRADKGLKP